MRIGLVTGEFPPDQGGVGDFTHHLAEALAALGHDVHVVTGPLRSDATCDLRPATRALRPVPCIAPSFPGAGVAGGRCSVSPGRSVWTS
jgi:glycosyltransferase involved in cell wall biosynthesis